MKILIGSKLLRNHIHQQDEKISEMWEKNKLLEQQVLDAKDETIKVLKDCKKKLS